MELLYNRVALLVGSNQKISYASALSDDVSCRGYFTSFRLVWDLGIIFILSMIQFVEYQVVMEFLEHKQSLGREDGNVPIFGLPYYVVKG